MNCTCTADNKNCFHIKKKMKLVDSLKNVVQMWHRFFLKVFLDSVVEKIIIPHDASFSYVYLYISPKKLCILLCCVALRSSCSEHEKIFEHVTKNILICFSDQTLQSWSAEKCHAWINLYCVSFILFHS